MIVVLHIFEDDNEILKQEFEEGTYVIGREETCDLVLSDESVSRRHVELRVTETAVYVSNLSSGEMLVNGDAVETAEVLSGDSVKIGRYGVVPSFDSASDQTPSDARSDMASSSHPPAFPPQQGNLAEALEPEFGAEPVAEGALQEEGGTAQLNVAETRVEMKPLVAKVIFVDGPNKDQEFFLETYEVTFGRSKKADIFIDDEKLSRLHAKISRVGHGYRLIDQGSRNGTYVNGIRVLEHPLSSFDEISFGSSKIKFIIHDMANLDQPGGTSVGLSKVDQTRSMQVDPAEQARILELHRKAQPPAGKEPPPPGARGVGDAPGLEPEVRPSRIPKALMIAVIVGGLIYYFLPQNNPEKTRQVPTSNVEATAPKFDQIRPESPPPSMPKEYAELSPRIQRRLEGFYQSALRSAKEENYQEAVGNLRKIHSRLPYYKDSRNRLLDYEKKLKEREVREARSRAEKEDGNALKIYLDEGLTYLKQGNFERAAEAFNSAIVIDPNNEVAAKGLKAAEKRITDISKLPPDRNPEKEKELVVKQLFDKALAAFQKRSYQEAIQFAEQIRRIELRGQDKYLNEAKQIIDLARNQQKEEFEPFLVEAKEKFAEQDYNAARDLCEEMVKRDPAYKPAVDLLGKSKKKLNGLAKEAYTYGMVLESVNKLDEAIQYWNRARQYVRPGDPYYDKVTKKLEAYE